MNQKNGKYAALVTYACFNLFMDLYLFLSYDFRGWRILLLVLGEVICFGLYANVMFKDPGFVSHPGPEINGIDLEPPASLRYCYSCEFFRPIRSKHCTFCRRCVAGYDHHCPWIQNCVGYNNHKEFMMFLVCQCPIIYVASFPIFRRLFHEHTPDFFAQQVVLWSSVFSMGLLMCMVSLLAPTHAFFSITGLNSHAFVNPSSGRRYRELRGLEKHWKNAASENCCVRVPRFWCPSTMPDIYTRGWLSADCPNIPMPDIEEPTSEPTSEDQHQDDTVSEEKFLTSCEYDVNVGVSV